MGRRGRDSNRSSNSGRGYERQDPDPVHADDVPDSILDLVTFMAKNLVKYPDEVDVDIVDGDTRPIIELRVNQEDLGHVIGRHGRTSRAMRLLVNAAATKSKVRVDLDIIDDEEDAAHADADTEHDDD